MDISAFSFLITIIVSLQCMTSVSGNLWCYSCVSSQPGCEEFYVNWFIHHAITCPRQDDKCVKIVERRGADVQVTRDCLSNLIGFRKDIPADNYEGCRPAAAQPNTAVYVENHVKELDLKRDFWQNTTYCFCEFDEWCNSGTAIRPAFLLLLMSLLSFMYRALAS